MARHGKCRLTPERLLIIYRRLQTDPFNIFTMQELAVNSRMEKAYMTTLERLGLVEQVPYIYYSGTKLIQNRTVMGWRIKK